MTQFGLMILRIHGIGPTGSSNGPNMRSNVLADTEIGDAFEMLVTYLHPKNMNLIQLL